MLSWVPNLFVSIKFAIAHVETKHDWNLQQTLPGLPKNARHLEDSKSLA
jgi:hypothetical protein